MAKKNKDETPIQFSDPSWGTKGSRIPTPLNQRGWIYKSYYNNDPSPSPMGAALAIFMLLVSIALLLLIFINPEASYVWILAIVCIAITVFMFLSNFRQTK